MLHFENDYNKGAHPKLLQALIETNNQAQAGYGMDEYSQQAAEKIKQACACPQAEVTFLTGGTQTNQVVIDSMLSSYEGVIAAESGHVAVHEAGAIEFTGHMVFPGMVYISHPTEYGTLYSKAELEALSKVCRAYSIPLFLDGARLGYGLASKESDLDLKAIAELTDVFYIGGTKLGALMGEAVVFTKSNQPKHFTTVVKQHGALLAKGRLCGVQFDAFFTDDLYLEIGRETLALAEQLKAILKEKGYHFYLDSPTNQQFIIIENHKLESLAKQVAYSFWEKYDDNHTVIRLAVSWSTTQEDIDALKVIL